ncbi:MAG: hypothetical protein WC492_04750 [Candidatus Micrarchaeia archaeon]
MARHKDFFMPFDEAMRLVADLLQIPLINLKPKFENFVYNAAKEKKIPSGSLKWMLSFSDNYNSIILRPLSSRTCIEITKSAYLHKLNGFDWKEKYKILINSFPTSIHASRGKYSTSTDTPRRW